MRIILVMNKPMREKRIMELIRKAIIEVLPGSCVRVCSYSDNNFIGQAIRFCPDVIVTYPFTGKGLSENIYLVKYFTNCLVLTFSTEGFINIDLQSTRVGIDNYGNSLVDFACFWGSNIADVHSTELIKQGKLRSRDQVKIFGYPNYEIYNKNLSLDAVYGTLPEPIESKFSQYKKQDIVFLITGFASAFYTEDELKKGGDVDLSGNRLAGRLECCQITRKYRDAFVENLCATAVQFPEVLYIVKIHPIELSFESRYGHSAYSKLDNYDNVLMVRDETTTMHIMPHVGLFCHYGSTVVNESYLVSIPSVLFTYQPYEEMDPEFRNFVWGMPYDAKIEINELARTIESYKRGEIFFHHNEAIKEYLLGNFNIVDINNYRPSLEMALFIVNNRKCFTPVCSDDKYLKKILIKMKFIKKIKYFYYSYCCKFRNRFN